jgi:hypothetical protein
VLLPINTRVIDESDCSCFADTNKNYLAAVLIIVGYYWVVLVFARVKS